MSGAANSPLVQSSAFELREIALVYPGTARRILSDFSLSIARGEFLSVVGPSGCGKSTLLKLIAGLITPISGTVTRMTVASTTAHRIGFVFQHPTLLPWRTAENNLQLPLELGGSLRHERLTHEECRELLKQVGLGVEDAGKRPAELSGGMQMRLSLARALATQPDVLLLDEPFAAVDDLLRLRLQEDVRRLHETRKLTTLLVTHNLHEAVFLSDRVIVLSAAPAKILADVAVNSPRSRTADFRDSEPCFAALRLVSSALFHAVPADSAESSAS